MNDATRPVRFWLATALHAVVLIVAPPTVVVLLADGWTAGAEAIAAGGLVLLYGGTLVSAWEAVR